MLGKDRKIKIMHIVFSLERGGAEKVVFELARRMNSLFKVSVCSLSGEGIFSAKLKKEGVSVFSFQKKEGIDYSLFFKLAHLLRKEKIDIVHTHDNSTLLYGTLSAKFSGIKSLFHTEHGGIYFETKKKKMISRWLWQQNKKVICVSENIKKRIKKEAGRSLNGKLEVIFNGVDFERFNIEVDRKKKREELGLKMDDFVICNIGRLSPEKNQEILINCAKFILKRFPESKFLIVGGGSLFEKYREKIRKENLDKYVFLLGEREDIPQILKISDCFVSCSNFESFGLALVEAAGAGLPVVATSVGGVKEILKDVDSCIFISPQVQELIKAILKIKENYSFFKKKASSSQIKIKERFDISKMVERYKKIYLDERRFFE